MKKKFLFLCLFLTSLSLFSAEILNIKPDRSFVLDESKYILPYHFKIFSNPYNNDIFVQVPFGYVIYNKNGNLVKKCIYNSSQEPGGLTKAYCMAFYKNFYFVSDDSKVNMYDYGNKFIKCVQNGIGPGLDAYIGEKGEVCRFGFIKGLTLLNEKGEEVAKNSELLIKPKPSNPMINYYLGTIIYFDKYEKHYYLTYMYKYEIFKLSSQSLKVIEKFGETPSYIKFPDDKKPNLYRRTSIEEYIKIVNGYSIMGCIFSNKQYLFVYYYTLYDADAYIDIIDKKKKKKVKTLKLSPTISGNRRYNFCYDDMNLKFYQEDIVPDKDDDEKTVIREYDLKRYVNE